jgi:two-component system, OmpR family, sensor kinase
VSRLKLRARLTFVFAGAMAIVLAAAGFVLYDYLATSLDRTLAQGLRARAADVTALVQQADTGLHDSRSGAAPGSGFAQVLDRRGRVFDETPGLGPRVLTASQLRRAGAAAVVVPRTHADGSVVRLFAVPVVAQGRKLIVVVGTPLAARDQALADLQQGLLIGGPIALLLTALVGYLVAGAALRPVERMRSRAAAISERDLSERLPVSNAGDELTALGMTLNELLERIGSARTRERRFVSDASHELRTPLALVRTEVELALEGARSEPVLEAALRSVGEEADRLSQLAEDLLLLARLDEDGLRLHTEPTELAPIVAGVAARYERRAREAGRRIEADGHGLRADVDRPRVEQALANLVENALRHGSGTIRIAGIARADRVELHVSDEGRGFSPAFAAHAFERFSRADEARNGSGAGLGLAIVKTVADAHGGGTGIGAQSGGGADVWLSFPAPSS